MLKVGSVFADAQGPSVLVEHIYAYDVLGRTDRSAEFSIDKVEFEQQDWRAVGLAPTDVEKLKAHFRDALERVFVKRYQDRFATPESTTADASPMTKAASPSQL